MKKISNNTIIFPLLIKMLKNDEEAFMNQVLGNIRMDEGSEERICNELSDINKQIFIFVWKQGFRMLTKV